MNQPAESSVDRLARANDALARHEPQHALRSAIAAEALTPTDSAAHIDALFIKATAQDQLGQSDASIATLNDALLLANQHELAPQRLQLLDRLADRLYTVGRYREALEHWIICVELAIAAGDIPAYVQAYSSIGGILDATGDYARALSHHERALSYSSALINARLYIDIRLYLAADYIRLGQSAKALEMLDDADRMITAHPGFETHQAETCLYRGQAMLALGHAETGAICLREGARLAEASHHAWAQVMCLLRLGQAHASWGELRQAEQVLKSAKFIAESTAIRLQLQEIDRTLAELYEASGRPHEALLALRAAHALQESLQRQMPRSSIENRTIKRLAQLDTQLNLALSRQENQRLRETQNDQSQLLDRLHIEAYQDGLTGLANRRWLDAHLLTRLDGWRGEPALSLLVLDIDHFKLINDDFSHLVGDAVLRQVSELLRLCCRGHDTAVRFGGEEFVILLESLHLDEAAQVAERIRQRIAQHDWRHMLGDRPLTLSAGVAEAQPGEDAAALIVRADEALYAAKRHGRNRVELAAQTVRATATA